jgi:hypothetical protein
MLRLLIMVIVDLILMLISYAFSKGDSYFCVSFAIFFGFHAFVLLYKTFMLFLGIMHYFYEQLEH